MMSPNKFRSKNVLNKSHKKLHGLIPCSIIEVNVIVESLYPTHTMICKVPQSSSEFQAQIQPQRPGKFFNVSKRRPPIGRWVKEIAKQTNTPLSRVKLLIRLWMVYQFTQSLQRYQRPS